MGRTDYSTRRTKRSVGGAGQMGRSWPVRIGRFTATGRTNGIAIRPRSAPRFSTCLPRTGVQPPNPALHPTRPTRNGCLGAVQRLLQDGGGDAPCGAGSAELSRLWEPAAWARCWAHDRNSTYYQEELTAQADLLREILGNPFSGVDRCPWLAGLE